MERANSLVGRLITKLIMNQFTMEYIKTRKKEVLQETRVKFYVILLI